MTKSKKEIPQSPPLRVKTQPEALPRENSPLDKSSFLCDNRSDGSERSIVSYLTSDGRAPIEYWLTHIKDKRAKAVILNRIDRVRLGNFGDCKSVGSGVYELRIHFGSGFRVYFGIEDKEIIVLICGGDKSTQRKDIEIATKCWRDYKSYGNQKKD